MLSGSTKILSFPNITYSICSATGTSLNHVKGSNNQHCWPQFRLPAFSLAWAGLRATCQTGCYLESRKQGWALAFFCHPVKGFIISIPIIRFIIPNVVPFGGRKYKFFITSATNSIWQLCISFITGHLCSWPHTINCDIIPWLSSKQVCSTLHAYPACACAYAEEWTWVTWLALETRVMNPVIWPDLKTELDKLKKRLPTRFWLEQQ